MGQVEGGSDTPAIGHANALAWPARLELFLFSTPLEAAFFYRRELNYSLIPVKIWWSKVENKWIKTPVIKEWKPYQFNLPTEEEIRGWFSGPENQIALVTGKINNLYVFDLDFSEMDLEEREKAVCFFPESWETVIVESPRGGNHYYCKLGEENNGVELKSFSGGKQGYRVFPPWVDFRGEGGLIVAPPSKRPDGKGYSFISCHEVGDLHTQISIIPVNIFNILSINKRNIIKDGGVGEGQFIDGTYKELTHGLTLCLQNGTRNKSLNKILYHAYRGGLSVEDGSYLANFIGKSTLDKSGENVAQMEPKTVTATNLSAWKASQGKSFSEEVKRWVTLQDGWFSLTDFQVFYGNTYKTLTREEKANLYVVLRRLVVDKVIEKHPDRTGCYRKINRDLVRIDLLAPSEKEWELNWPLEFEKLIYIYPKNIIVPYASINGGKSAFMYNLMYRNMDKFKGKINYFISEAGGEELKSRLRYYKDISLEKWMECIKMYEKSDNFHGVIIPDEINIIDFLEIHKDFSEIGILISSIWKELTTGIAIICLQSKENADLPRGAEFALEKARLAFSLLKMPKYHLCKIRKAKNWKTDMNPNWKVKRFAIVDGCKILTSDNWMDEEQFLKMHKNKTEIEEDD